MFTSRSYRLAPVGLVAALAAAAALAPAASAAAQRYAAPTGAGLACSSASPCSLRQAVEDAAAGDEVVVSPGDYPLSATLTDWEQITIHGVAGQPRPRLQFSGPGQNGLWLEFGSTLRYVEVDQAAGDSGQIALGAFTGAKVDQVIAKAPAVAAEIRNSTIRNSIVVASGTNGRALYSGAVGSYSSTSTARNVTAIATGSGGVPIEAYAGTNSNATVHLVNTIAWGGPGALSLLARTENGGIATITATHTDYQSADGVGIAATIVDGGGNRPEDPAFVNAAAGDYRQAPGSYTIGAGLDDPANGAFDVGGDPRKVGTTDIGADEYLPPPAATTGAAGAITTHSAALGGSVNPKGAPTSYHFQYGPTTAYGSTTPNTAAGSGTSTVAAAATLGALSPARTYHYRLVATNAGGATKGADRTLITASQAPTASTGTAGAVTDHSATLSGSVNPNGAPTSYHFQYGTTTAYGSATASTSAGSGKSAVAAGATPAGLSPARTYHYRIVATSVGGVANGADRTFTTAAVTTPTTLPPAQPFAGVRLVSTRLTMVRRSITVKLSCPSGTVGRCSGRTKLTIRRRRTTSHPASTVRLGRKRFSIAAGQRARVRVPVSREGRRLLRRRGQLRGRNTNAARNGAGVAKTTVARVTIRRRHH